MTQTPAEIAAMTLIERIEAESVVSDNRLDVEIEIALFRPNSVYSAIRANAAGTKVIYTDAAGNPVTCWAQDYTSTTRLRQTSAAALRARSSTHDA